MSRAAVLIISSDPLSAALLGAAVELAELVPNFPQVAEGARPALLRVRPQLVIVDCDHDEACSDAFVGPAIMTGARVMLLRSRRSTTDRAELAKRLGLTVVEMPLEHETLGRLLHEALTR